MIHCSWTSVCVHRCWPGCFYFGDSFRTKDRIFCVSWNDKAAESLWAGSLWMQWSGGSGGDAASGGGGGRTGVWALGSWPMAARRLQLKFTQGDLTHSHPHLRPEEKFTIIRQPAVHLRVFPSNKSDPDLRFQQKQSSKINDGTHFLFKTRGIKNTPVRLALIRKCALCKNIDTLVFICVCVFDKWLAVMQTCSRLVCAACTLAAPHHACVLWACWSRAPAHGSLAAVWGQGGRLERVKADNQDEFHDAHTSCSLKFY